MGCGQSKAYDDEIREEKIVFDRKSVNIIDDAGAGNVRRAFKKLLSSMSNTQQTTQTWSELKEMQDLLDMNW